ncbi:hypothetical protein [Nocardia sp. NPDC057440]|uniref:hypothetical protein n=1 Tax=Nocardia sp. NPDC057440 TaxID=3346134 RepID=UPI00366CDDEF
MDDYDNDRKGYKPHLRGTIFEHGASNFFRDRENGYSHGSRIYETSEGRIKFDHVKEVDSHLFSIEDKSGRIDGDKDVTQLMALRELLRSNEKHKHLLRSVEGESISKECQELINGLKRDFPDRFTHLEISRADARTIWALGRDLVRGKQLELEERGKQLELPGVGEKAREEKAQELQRRRETIAQLARARERAEKFRKMQQFRQAAARGRAEAPRQVQAERARQPAEPVVLAKPAREVSEAAKRAERARVEREAAERAAREFPVPSQLLGRAVDAEEPDKARAERDAAEKAREAREADRPAPEQADRAREAEAAARVQQHREFFAAQRERAERAGILDSVRVVQLQWNQPGEVRQPEPVDAAAADGHRSLVEGRERARVEERDRDERLRGIEQTRE